MTSVVQSNMARPLLLRYCACRVAQLLAELHHVQCVMHRANKYIRSPWARSDYEHSASLASLLPLQDPSGGVLPSGWDAGPPVSQIQLLPRLQKRTILQMPVEQAPVDRDAGHAHGIVRAQLRRPHAQDTGTIELMHEVQRRTGQRPIPNLCSSRRGAQPIEEKSTSAQHSPERPVADSMRLVRSEEAPGKSAQRPGLGYSTHAISNDNTTAAYQQQKSDERMSAPLNTSVQLSTAHLMHLPGHSDEEGSTSSSAGATAPHRSATYMRCDRLRW